MTLEELKNVADEATQRIAELGSFLKIDDRREKLNILEQKMANPDFWNNKEQAQATVADLSSCKNVIEPFNKLAEEVGDFEVLMEMAEEDPDMLDEADATWKKLSKDLDKIELLSFLSGKFDRNNAYFSIHAGAGGTESCDWTSMFVADVSPLV